MRKVFRTKRKRNYKIILFILVLVSTIFIANLMIKNTSKEYIIDGKLNHFKIDIDKEKIVSFVEAVPLFNPSIAETIEIIDTSPIAKLDPNT